jgi:hypothetical protein
MLIKFLLLITLKINLLNKEGQALVFATFKDYKNKQMKLDLIKENLLLIIYLQMSFFKKFRQFKTINSKIQLRLTQKDKNKILKMIIQINKIC